MEYLRDLPDKHRMRLALQWLRDNHSESPIIAPRIHFHEDPLRHETPEPIPPVVICPGVRIMESCFGDGETFEGGELIMTSPTGYTNGALAMICLNHFI